MADIKKYSERVFEDIKNIDENGAEFWYARDLQGVLEYTEWRNFKNVIEKAKEACEGSKISVSDQFVDVNKLIEIAKGAKREIDDIKLTRYACYLIVQNSDPRKEIIALGQTYFAIQTRKQEILEKNTELQDRLQARKKLTEEEKELSKNIDERGGVKESFGRVRSKGDAALFGGNTTKEMKQKLGIKESRPLADFLPTITITAKQLATQITNHNIKQNELHGENKITDEHVENNKSVRNTLVERGIKPEELPPEEDLQKLERKVKREIESK